MLRSNSPGRCSLPTTDGPESPEDMEEDVEEEEEDGGGSGTVAKAGTRE